MFAYAIILWAMPNVWLICYSLSIYFLITFCVWFTENMSCQRKKNYLKSKLLYDESCECICKRFRLWHILKADKRNFQLKRRTICLCLIYLHLHNLNLFIESYILILTWISLTFTCSCSDLSIIYHFWRIQGQWRKYKSSQIKVIGSPLYGIRWRI